MNIKRFGIRFQTIKEALKEIYKQVSDPAIAKTINSPSQNHVSDIGLKELQREVAHLYPLYNDRLKIERIADGTLAVALRERGAFDGVLVHWGGYTTLKAGFKNIWGREVIVTDRPYYTQASNEEYARHPIVVKPGESRPLRSGTEIMVNGMPYIYLKTIR